MSLESAIDEERREVMNILEGRPTQYNSSQGNGQSLRTSSPAPPVRSMLDIGPAAARHSSIAGPTGGVTTSPLRSAPLTRSMLDPHSPPLPAVEQNQTGGGIHRAQSDASTKPPTWRPRAGSDRDRGGSGGALPYTENQFDMSSTVHGQSLPKRVTQGGKKGLGLSSMASIMQGQELEPLPMGRDQGRHNSTAGIIGGKSKSPSSRLSNRSQSPGGAMLNTNSFNLMSTPGKFVTDAGKVIDMNNAYRRLSDANLLKSGGQLSSLPASKNATERALSGETLSPTGGTRLQKDYYENDENGEAAIESSDEEHTSDEDAWGTPSGRGRRRSRRKKGAGGTDADNEDSENDRGLGGGPAGMGKSGGPKMAKSLMAAAEEESVYLNARVLL